MLGPALGLAELVSPWTILRWFVRSAHLPVNDASGPTDLPRRVDEVFPAFGGVCGWLAPARLLARLRTPNKGVLVMLAGWYDPGPGLGVGRAEVTQASR